MSIRKVLVGLSIAAIVPITGAAHASLIGSTISINAKNGFSNGGTVCKSASVAGATVGGSAELVGGDWTGGCVGYYGGDIGADITGNVLTLSSLESGNYSYASFHMHIDAGATITGASFVGYTANFFKPSGAMNDTNFLPVVTFDSDDVNILWWTGSNSSQFLFNGPLNGGSQPFGTAVFSITTTTVPEPASLALTCPGNFGPFIDWERLPGGWNRSAL